MSLALAGALALLSALAFLGAGYLLGVRLGRGARDALRADLDRAMAAQSSGAASALPQQIDTTLKALLGPLLERESETRELREAVTGLLRPMAERERLGLELTRLDQDLADKVGLSPLLTSIARRAGFSAIVITDDAGLELACNDLAPGRDLLAASASLLLTLIDRIVKNGGEAPLAAVLRNSQNQNVLHRVFRVGEQRYVLTAVMSGGYLPPDVLDPTLARVESLLAAHQPGA